VDAGDCAMASRKLSMLPELEAAAAYDEEFSGAGGLTAAAEALPSCACAMFAESPALQVHIVAANVVAILLIILSPGLLIAAPAICFMWPLYCTTASIYDAANI
jgi:hypothetical protein